VGEGRGPSGGAPAGDAGGQRLTPAQRAGQVSLQPPNVARGVVVDHNLPAAMRHGTAEDRSGRGRRHDSPLHRAAVLVQDLGPAAGRSSPCQRSPAGPPVVESCLKTVRGRRESPARACPDRAHWTTPAPRRVPCPARRASPEDTPPGRYRGGVGPRQDLYASQCGTVWWLSGPSAGLRMHAALLRRLPDTRGAARPRPRRRSPPTRARSSSCARSTCRPDPGRSAGPTGRSA